MRQAGTLWWKERPSSVACQGEGARRLLSRDVQQAGNYTSLTFSQKLGLRRNIHSLWHRVFRAQGLACLFKKKHTKKPWLTKARYGKQPKHSLTGKLTSHHSVMRWNLTSWLKKINHYFHLLYRRGFTPRGKKSQKRFCII